MKKIVKMEVVSIEEAEEMGDVLESEITENGFLCTVETEDYTVPVSPEFKAEPKKDYYIYSPSCSMYVANKGYSYYAGDAKLFDKKTATQKAYFMSKHGYKWEAYQL